MKKEYKEMTEKWIKDFVNLLYSHRKGKIMIVAIDKTKNDIVERIIYPSEIEKHIKFLRALNSKGYNIHITVNMLKENAENRRAESFYDKQTTIYLDFDSKHRQAYELFKLLYLEIETNRLPEPSLIVKTSKGNYQLYWAFNEEIKFSRLRAVMKALNKCFYLDPTHDVTRTFRLVGFRNLKQGKDDLVQPVFNNTVWINKKDEIKIEATMKRYSIEDFERIEENFSSSLNEDVRKIKKTLDLFDSRVEIEDTKLKKLEELYNFYQKSEYYMSRSERDIAFVIKALCSSDYEEEEIVNFLREKRQDKHNSLYYAKLTLEKAKNYILLKRKENS